MADFKISSQLNIVGATIDPGALDPLRRKLKGINISNVGIKLAADARRQVQSKLDAYEFKLNLNVPNTQIDKMARQIQRGLDKYKFAINVSLPNNIQATVRGATTVTPSPQVKSRGSTVVAGAGNVASQTELREALRAMEFDIPQTAKAIKTKAVDVSKKIAQQQKLQRRFELSQSEYESKSDRDAELRAVKSLGVRGGGIRNVGDSLRGQAKNAVKAAKEQAQLQELNSIKQLSSVQSVIKPANKTEFFSSSFIPAREINTGTDAIREYGRQVGITAKRFSAYIIASSIFDGLLQSVAKSSQEFVKFDKEVTRLGQTLRLSGSQTAPLVKDVRDLSVGLGVSSQDLLKTATTLGQAGIPLREIKDLLPAIARTDLSPSFESLEQTTEGVIAIKNQFKIASSEFDKILSQINVVAANTAAESRDFIEGVKRSGAAVSQAKGSFQEFLAVFGAVRSTTRQSPSVIATALSSFTSKLQTDKSAKAFKELAGVDLRTKTGEFVGFFEAVTRIQQALSNPELANKTIDILREGADVRQLRAILPIFTNFTEIQRILALTQAGANSTTIDQIKAQDSLANQFKRTSEAADAAFASFAKNEGVKIVTSSFVSLAQSLTGVASALGDTLPLLVALSGISLFRKGVAGNSTIHRFIGGVTEGLGGNFSGFERVLPHNVRRSKLRGQSLIDFSRAVTSPANIIENPRTVFSHRQILAQNDITGVNTSQFGTSAQRHLAYSATLDRGTKADAELLKTTRALARSREAIYVTTIKGSKLEELHAQYLKENNGVINKTSESYKVLAKAIDSNSRTLSALSKSIPRLEAQQQAQIAQITRNGTVAGQFSNFRSRGAALFRNGLPNAVRGGLPAATGAAAAIGLFADLSPRDESGNLRGAGRLAAGGLSNAATGGILGSALSKGNPYVAAATATVSLVSFIDGIISSGGDVAFNRMSSKVQEFTEQLGAGKLKDGVKAFRDTLSDLPNVLYNKDKGLFGHTVDFIRQHSSLPLLGGRDNFTKSQALDVGILEAVQKQAGLAFQTKGLTRKDIEPLSSLVLRLRDATGFKPSSTPTVGEKSTEEKLYIAYNDLYESVLQFNTELKDIPIKDLTNSFRSFAEIIDSFSRTADQVNEISIQSKKFSATFGGRGASISELVGRPNSIFSNSTYSQRLTAALGSNRLTKTQLGLDQFRSDVFKSLPQEIKEGDIASNLISESIKQALANNNLLEDEFKAAFKAIPDALSQKIADAIQANDFNGAIGLITGSNDLFKTTGDVILGKLKTIDELLGDFATGLDKALGHTKNSIELGLSATDVRLEQLNFNQSQIRGNNKVNVGASLGLINSQRFGLNGSLDPEVLANKLLAAEKSKITLSQQESGAVDPKDKAKFRSEIQNTEKEIFKLTKALDALGTTSQETGIISQRLAELESLRNRKLSLGEKLFTGDAEAITKLSKGLALAQLVGPDGNLGELDRRGLLANVENRRDLADTLSLTNPELLEKIFGGLVKGLGPIEDERAQLLEQANAVFARATQTNELLQKNAEVLSGIFTQTTFDVQQAIINVQQANGGVEAKASGGFVGGVGNRDTIPAMLTPGEFVVRKDKAQKFGGLLSALNSGKIQGFANGGSVEFRGTTTFRDFIEDLNEAYGGGRMSTRNRMRSRTSPLITGGALKETAATNHPKIIAGVNEQIDRIQSSIAARNAAIFKKPSVLPLSPTTNELALRQQTLRLRREVNYAIAKNKSSTGTPYVGLPLAGSEPPTSFGRSGASLPFEPSNLSTRSNSDINRQVLYNKIRWRKQLRDTQTESDRLANLNRTRKQDGLQQLESASPDSIQLLKTQRARERRGLSSISSLDQLKQNHNRVLGIQQQNQAAQPGKVAGVQPQNSPSVAGFDVSKFADIVNKLDTISQTLSRFPNKIELKVEPVQVNLTGMDFSNLFKDEVMEKIAEEVYKKLTPDSLRDKVEQGRPG